MKYQWLLFDFDNTLVDFNRAGKLALWQTFTDFGFPCTEEIEATYKGINAQVWAAFERHEISAAELRIKRFAELFEKLPEAPANPAHFSVRFLENLVLQSEAYDNVIPLLERLRKQYRLGLITNGLKEVQRPRLHRLKMTHLFDSVTVSDEIGIAKPHGGFFEHAHHSLGRQYSKEQLLVIGDNLHSDIKGANAYGLASCWVSHGNVNETDIQPDFSVQQVLSLPEILD
jgi:YjjG family noncanonical pyrimidine nucleotidase